MKYLKQFFIIMFITFLGEVLRWLIPLPIPASIYGMVLLLIALCIKLIRLEEVKETSVFFIEIMPIMFIPASVGLIDSWGSLKGILLPLVVMIPVTTVAVMGVTGVLTQSVIRQGKGKQPANVSLCEEAGIVEEKQPLEPSSWDESRKQKEKLSVNVPLCGENNRQEEREPLEMLSCDEIEAEKAQPSLDMSLCEAEDMSREGEESHE